MNLQIKLVVLLLTISLVPLSGVGLLSANSMGQLNLEELVDEFEVSGDTGATDPSPDDDLAAGDDFAVSDDDVGPAASDDPTAADD